MIRMSALAFALALLGAAPQAAPTANPPLGVGPLTVTFSSIPAGGVLYEWDFDFLPSGFTPDFTDVVAGDVTTSYTAIGLYTARLIVTSELGAQTTYDVAVAVAPPTGPPNVQFFRDSEIPPGPTTFKVEAVPVVGASITMYEWDVENDGTVDQSGAALSTINFLNGGNGSYQCRVVVTDSLSQVTTLLQHYNVGVTSPFVMSPLDPPGILSFTATTAGATKDLLPLASTLDVRVGDLVTVDVDVNSGPFQFGVVVFTRFDFDGRNGVVQFDRSVPSGLVADDASVTHHYDTPGTYTLTVQVLDTENSITTKSATVNVTVEPGVFKTWLFQPRNGQRVFGDVVTLRAKAFPASQTAAITFKYRAVSGGAPPPPADPSWTTIKTVTPPPFTFLSTTWDVTGLAPGDYDLAAVAARTLGGSAESVSNERVVVTVDPAAPEILETSLADLQQGIDPNRNESSGLSGDVIVDIPSGSTPAYDQMRVQRRSTNPHPLEARLQGLNFLQGHFRKINFDGGLENLFVPSRVTFYVSDKDGDGLVDGQPFSKSTLKVYRFNPLLKEWQALNDQVLQPSEDLVKASLQTVGDVGIAAEFDGSRTDAGSSSDCGLLGLELLALLGLVRAGSRRFA